MVIRAKWHSRSLVGISAPLSLLVLLLVFSFTVPRPSIFYKKKKLISPHMLWLCQSPVGLGLCVSHLTRPWGLLPQRCVFACFFHSGANPARPGAFPGANSPGPVADLYGPTSQESAVGNYISAASPQPGSGFSHGIAVSITHVGSHPTCKLSVLKVHTVPVGESLSVSFPVLRLTYFSLASFLSQRLIAS